MNKKDEKLAIKVARNSIIINILLSGFKLFAGIFANSVAMISDAIHSIADLFTTLIAIIGIKLANKEPDQKHPYGHERFECVATIILAFFIFSVGVGIGWTGIGRVMSGDYRYFAIPGILALIAAVVSIIVKESLFWYVKGTAKKVDSSALMADAWHSRIDGLTSIGSFIGIFGARMGFPILDSVAAIFISLFILKTAFSIFVDAIGKMTDMACDEATIHEMKTIILNHESVVSIDKIKTRLFGNKIYVDVDIVVDSELTLNDAHNIAQEVHDNIEKHFPKVRHCMVHVNPKE